MIIGMIATIHELLWNHKQDGDILEDTRRDKVLHQQTQGEEIIRIN
jgi:hypothetical protein